MRTRAVVVFLLLIPLTGYGQFMISGRVLDKKTLQPVSFVSIYCRSSGTGSHTNDSGYFSIRVLHEQGDSILFSELGYVDFKGVFPPDKKAEVWLQSSEMALRETQITGYRDPGRHVVRMIIENRNRNDRNEFTHEYNLLKVELAKLNPAHRHSFFNKIAGIYAGILNDSSAGTAPLFMSEKFFSGKTRIAEKNLGLPTDAVSPLFDKFMIRLNPYDGVMPVLKTTFISPASGVGLAHYNYRIIDTVADLIRVHFAPKYRNGNTFEGEFRVNDSSWAIMHIDMVTSAGGNINYVNRLSVIQDYDPAGGLKKNTTVVELMNGMDLLNLPFKTDSLDKTLYISSKSIFNNGQEDTLRPEPLSGREQAVYAMADSLRHDKSYIRTTKVAAFFANGQWDVGYVKLGNLTSLFSSNTIEGYRGRLNLYTTEKLNPTISLNGFLAYGTRDQRWKGGIGVKYVPSRNPYRKTELLFKKDYNTTIQDDDELDNDNVFSIAFHKPIPAMLEFNETVSLLQEWDVSPVLSAKIHATYRKISPSFDYQYYNKEDPFGIEHIVNDAQLGVALRYARDEKSTFINFDKVRFGSTKPVFTFKYIYGFELNGKTPFEYHKVSVGISQNVNLPPKGSLFYNFSAGKSFGVMPSMLLHIPMGNNNYVANKYAFNNMVPYEYAADTYAQVNFIYNGGGILFDRIGLLRKLKLRERLITNVYWGSMSGANQNYNKTYPLKSLQGIPYIESGFGIANILSVMYIDCMWRVTERSSINKFSNFGVYIGTRIAF